MLARLSLRLRVFLFFAALAMGSVAVIAASLWFAGTRTDPSDATAALMTGGVLSAFVVTGLVLIVWWLFDENVAKAIQRLSADLRTRAHAPVAREMDTTPARYLGDLAPAAGAVINNLCEVRSRMDLTITEQTQRLKEQTAQLSALLSDIQAGLLLCSSAHRLVFYNAPATDLLRDTGRPRLDRCVFDLLGQGPIERTYKYLIEENEPDAELLVTTTGCGRILVAHMRLVSGALGIGTEPGYVLTLRDVSADLRVHAQRQRLLNDAITGLSARADALRAALDARGDSPLALTDEALKMADIIDSLERRHAASTETWWPMQNVRASHLVDALRGQLGEHGPEVRGVTPPLTLRCDAYAMVNLLAALIETALSDRLGQAFGVEISENSTGARITLSWQGAPMTQDRLATVLASPLKDSPLAVTGREILDFHNTHIWAEPKDDGSFAIVLPLHCPQQAGIAALENGGIAERPTVFDFDLLNRVPDRSKAGKPLRDLTFVVFDTETTGLDPKGGDEIVQIAAVRLLNGKRVDGEVINQLVNPERGIPPGSTQVHGISETMVLGAPTIDAVGPRFHRFCEDAVLVAHNAPFDMAFFHKHAARIGAEFDHPVFDTVLLSATLFGQGEPHTLDALADRFGVVIPEKDRHTAYGDTVATAEVFQRMIPMLEARGIDTFDAVLDAMQKNSRLLREMHARVG
jgi:DNA polymerase-3 subunit epsilon